MSFFIPPQSQPIVPGFFSQGNPATPAPRNVAAYQSQLDNLTGPTPMLDSVSPADAPWFRRDQEEYALDSVQEVSPLNSRFFSLNNINVIQGLLQKAVFAKSNFIIGRQSDTELLIVMRGLYLQYSRYNPNAIDQEVQRLNEMVVTYCTPRIISAALQYQGYIKDIGSPLQIMAHPVNTSVIGTKRLRPVTDVLVGDPFN